MTRLRTLIFWTHLATGITIGAVVFVMAVSGALLAYQRQIQSWADMRGIDVPEPMPGSTPLAPDELVARVRQIQPGVITGLRWHRDPDAPVEVQLGRDALLFADPNSGAILGDGSQRARAFFRIITDAHRWLALDETRVQTGRAITGAANLAFLFMVMSGFYLWFPRNLTARALRNAMVFRRGLRPKARDFNWHTVIGFWSLFPLTIIIASAVVISYGWAGAVVENLAAESAAPAADASAAPTEAGVADAATEPAVTAATVADAEPRAAGDSATLADLLGRARAQEPRWRSITMQLPPRRGELSFIIDRGSGGQPHLIDRLTLDRATGQVATWEPFPAQSRPRRARSVLRYAHTGEVGGVVGQTIAGLVSVGVALLVWTGISLTLRRLAAWRRRRGSGTRYSNRQPQP